MCQQPELADTPLFPLQQILETCFFARKNNPNKLGLSSAKLSRTKLGWCEVIFEFVLKQFTVE